MNALLAVLLTVPPPDPGLTKCLPPPEICWRQSRFWGVYNRHLRRCQGTHPHDLSPLVEHCDWAEEVWYVAYLLGHLQTEDVTRRKLGELREQLGPRRWERMELPWFPPELLHLPPRE
jgi:hypothetical protein